MTQRIDPGPTGAPDWLTRVLGPAADQAVRLRWGFRNETWAGRLPDGRRVAATRLADPAAVGPLQARLRSVRPRLVAAGLPIPVPAEAALPWPPGVVVSEFVDGTAGPEILDRVDGPAQVGALLGSAWRRLRSVDSAGSGLPDRWASAERLLEAARGWSGAATPDLDPPDRRRLAAVLGALPRLVAGRQVGVVHGDLVPANILVADGHLVALLDLEAIRIADPLLDAGWCDWIVWFHHPGAEPAFWTAFEAAAGLDRHDPVTAELLHSYPIVRLLEILDGLAPGDPARPRWLVQLAMALSRPTT